MQPKIYGTETGNQLWIVTRPFKLGVSDPLTGAISQLIQFNPGDLVYGIMGGSKIAALQSLKITPSYKAGDPVSAALEAGIPHFLQHAHSYVKPFSATMGDTGHSRQHPHNQAIGIY